MAKTSNMTTNLTFLLFNWIISALAIVVAAYLLPGVAVELFAAFVAAVVLGFINAVVRPILLVLTLPINILTLGLFTFVLNAALILLTSRIVEGFTVENFWWALLFSLVLSIVNYVFGKMKK